MTIEVSRCQRSIRDLVYFVIDDFIFLAGCGAALSARIPSAVSHQTPPRTGPLACPDQRFLDLKSAVIV